MYFIYIAALIILIHSQALATPVKIELGDASLGALIATSRGSFSHIDEKSFDTVAGTILERNDEYHFAGLLVFAGLTIYNDNDPYSLRDDLSHDSVTSSPINEPATMLLLGAGIASLAGWRSRRKKK